MNENSENQPLEMPPFPLLIWRMYDWEFTDFFSSWQGFRANSKPKTGQVDVIVYVEELGHPPSPEQAIAYQFLKENEQEITNALLQSVFDRASQIREYYSCVEPEFNPPISSINELRRIIALHLIHINTEAKDNCAYVGFEFDSLWDEEHGFGVMMHKTQFIGWRDAEAARNLGLSQENSSELE